MSPVPPVLHRDLPPHSAFLSGRGPLDPAVGLVTERLQVYYRRDDDFRGDERSHAHERCDEIFVVLRGSIDIDVDGELRVVGPKQYCCFPAGVFHRIVRITTPLEALVIRAPSVEDKVYR